MAIKGKTAAKTPRLGRGLSALMAQPVKVTPPAPAQEAAVPAEPDRQSTASDTTPNPSQKAAAGKSSNPAAVAQAQEAAATDTTSDSQDTTGGGIMYLSPAVIRPNPHQPRREFDAGALKRLADSIKADGLMQPVIVRPISKGTHRDAAHTHELVAGERRWRAAQLAGLTTLPAIVRELDEHQTAQWALVENLQREDLNPMERAMAFHHLMDKFNLSHEEIARQVGVERPTISNSLRLLDLDSQVQDWVRQGRLSAGQARALAGLSDSAQQRALAQKVITQELSVRKVEEAVRAMAQGDEPAKAGGPLKTQARAAHLADLEEQLGRQLATKVRIRPGRKKGSGTMSIDFYSVDQFDALLKRLDVDTES